jgi:hypothetical protein
VQLLTISRIRIKKGSSFRTGLLCGRDTDESCCDLISIILVFNLFLLYTCIYMLKGIDGGGKYCGVVVKYSKAKLSP